PKSVVAHKRLVGAMLVPLIVTYVFGAIPPPGWPAFVIAAAVMVGFAEMLPKTPCFCPPGPEEKYSVLGSPTAPTPKVNAHSPGILMLLPLPSFICPT